MGEPLDEQYLTWLYHQVASVRLRNASKTYWSLLRQLYTKEYVWLVPNDDNRVEDGRDLRNEFLRDVDISVDLNWMQAPCSMLEMLIGLARRLAYEADEGESRRWFWTLMGNLDIRRLTDDAYDRLDPTNDVEEILDVVIWRTYDENGHGGLFPLTYPDQDQREVEIWYQMSQWLQEFD